MTPTPNITQVLVSWSNGDRRVFDELVPLISRELHMLAKRCMARETAEVLKVSVGSVRRDWTLARAWLHRELKPMEQA